MPRKKTKRAQRIGKPVVRRRAPRMSRAKKRQQSEAVIHQNILTEERVAFV